MKPTSPIRVLSVDDHAFLIDGLEARFDLEGDIELVGRLSRADTLIESVQALSPAIVLLDIEMPGADPFEKAHELARRLPDVRVIFLSAYVRDQYISQATKAGAWGYFSKGDPAGVLIDGIRRVAAGEVAFSPRVEERCRPTPGRRARANTNVVPGSRLETLSERELEVLRLIGRGLTRADIAKALSRSPKTIDGHRESIMQKLDIHDRAELVRFAIREGLVEA
ncbi:MAG: response regulator transcription factor [Phycisphaeraceae bacterium]|nr:response regulator transcription factor [Phycisphaeraceae bacterium]